MEAGGAGAELALYRPGWLRPGRLAVGWGLISSGFFPIQEAGLLPTGDSCGQPFRDDEFCPFSGVLHTWLPSCQMDGTPRLPGSQDSEGSRRGGWWACPGPRLLPALGLLLSADLIFPFPPLQGLPGPKGERGEKVSAQGWRAGRFLQGMRVVPAPVPLGRAVSAQGHVARLPSQGEPQSLATIYQLVSQACESAIQSEWPSLLVRPPCCPHTQPLMTMCHRAGGGKGPSHPPSLLISSLCAPTPLSTHAEVRLLSPREHQASHAHLGGPQGPWCEQ